MTGMTVSMDGFRHLVSDNVKDLRDLVKDVLDGECYDPDELREAMNAVVRSSNALNCFYSDDDTNFTDMSDLELDEIEEDEVEA